MVASEEDGYIYKIINGYRYYFDENGVMATGWTAVETKESTDVTGISTLKYLGDENDGRMAAGWLYITEDLDDSDSVFSFTTTATSSNAEADSDNGAWYYFNTSGVPRYLHSDASNISEAYTFLRLY